MRRDTKKPAPEIGKTGTGEKKETDMKNILTNKYLRKLPSTFCLWKFGNLTKNGKKPKHPYNPESGYRCSPTKMDGVSIKDAAKAAKNYQADGIGFIFNDSGFAGIDLDNCRDISTGKVEKWADELVQQLDSYTELSPSGTGFHILIRVKPGLNIGHKWGDLEAYTHGRYFTVTGETYLARPIAKRTKVFKALVREQNAIRENPQTSVDIPTEKDTIDEIRSLSAPFSNHKTIMALVQGNTDDYASASEADLSLCTYLAYITQQDKAEVDRLFRGSKLYRQKWERTDYRKRTIKKAIKASLKEFGKKADIERSRIIFLVGELSEAGETATREALIRELCIQFDSEARNKLFSILRKAVYDGKLYRVGGGYVTERNIETISGMGGLTAKKAKFKPHSIVWPMGLEKFLPSVPGDAILIHAVTDAGKTYLAAQFFILNVMAGNRTILNSAETSLKKTVDIIKKQCPQCEVTIEELEAKRIETKSDVISLRLNTIPNQYKDCIFIHDYLKVKNDYTSLAIEAAKLADSITDHKGVAVVFAQKKKGRRDPAGGGHVIEAYQTVCALNVDDENKYKRYLWINKNKEAYQHTGKYLSFYAQNDGFNLISDEPRSPLKKEKGAKKTIKRGEKE